MKKTLLLALTVMMFSCSSDSDSGKTNEPQQCEVNNESTIVLHNNTTNTWWYRIPDQTGYTVNSVSAGSLDVVTMDAGTYYEVTWYYPFTYDGVEYEWDVKSESHLGFYACATDDTSIDLACHNTGYIIYANSTNLPITMTIDGSSYAPIEPGEVEGYEVASGVTHNVTGTNGSGTYSLTPSVGECQRLATVLY